MLEPTQRFTSRVGDYARYRPSYPEALLVELARLAWDKNSTVADVGAGTGLFSRLVAPFVAKVWALEPNQAMRSQGGADSQGFSNLVWGEGSAEATGLSDHSLDALVSAQAFHWFDRGGAAVEWRRILKPGAPVVLVWNERDEESSNLQAEYNVLLNRHCPEYPKVNHKNVTLADLEAFFAPHAVTRLEFRNDQRFDLEGWYGRLRSASYCPPLESTDWAQLQKGMAVLFGRYKDADGLMTFPYVTRAYVSRLTAGGRPS